VYYLLGIDDTDSPATGDALNATQDSAALALSLGQKLEALGLAKLLNVSCHELFLNPSIAYTTSNTAHCLLLDGDPQKMREIDMTTRSTLRSQSAANANPGYALATWNQIDPEVVVWGQRAKTSILQRMDAINLAKRSGIAIAGISGSGVGVIGAFSAIGLRYDGNDGHINWMPGLDRLVGIYSQIEINHFIQFGSIETENQKRPALDDRILFSANTKPILKNGRIVLKVSPAEKKQQYQWQS